MSLSNGSLQMDSTTALSPWSSSNDQRERGDENNSRWFAVWTRSRQERVAAAMLSTLGVEHYLPMTTETRQWSDRLKAIETPLFPGYLFVRMNLNRDSRLQVLKVAGVADFVGNHSGPLPVPDQQIEGVRAVINHHLEYSLSQQWVPGDLVRVIRGPLAGIEGVLLRSNTSTQLLISIEMIHRCIAVKVSRQDLVLLHQITP
jgi:transcription antitermination factor NusG